MHETQAMKLIYVVEDHEVIRNGIVQYLSLSGYEGMGFGSIQSVREAFGKTAPDLLIQDVMLPDGDGFSFVKEMKEKYPHLPVIFLTARVEESDRILGFELGCDDFIISPFSYKEISLRVQARIKRYTAMDGDDSRVVFVNGTQELSMDKQSHKVTIDGRDVSFTVSEWKILLLLVENNNSVLSRVQIIESCFGYLSESYDRVVDTHIKNIRSKLGSNGKVWIETVRGYGYCFTGKLLRP